MSHNVSKVSVVVAENAAYVTRSLTRAQIKVGNRVHLMKLSGQDDVLIRSDSLLTFDYEPFGVGKNSIEVVFGLPKSNAIMTIVSSMEDFMHIGNRCSLDERYNDIIEAALAYQRAQGGLVTLITEYSTYANLAKQNAAVSIPYLAVPGTEIHVVKGNTELLQKDL